MATSHRRPRLATTSANPADDREFRRALKRQVDDLAATVTLAPSETDQPTRRDEQRTRRGRGRGEAAVAKRP